GSSKAYEGHHSKCISNQAFQNGTSISSVQTGQTFQATVKMYNDGTSIWSPNFGMYFGPYNNNGTAYTDWHVTGGGFSNGIPPQTEHTFNLTLTAPSTAGTYQFNWGIFIVYQGVLQIPCSGILNVTAPPTTPPSNPPPSNPPSSGGGSSGGSKPSSSGGTKTPTPSAQPAATPSLQGSDNSSTPNPSTDTSFNATVGDQTGSDNQAGTTQTTTKHTSVGKVILIIFLTLIGLAGAGVVGLVMYKRLQARRQQKSRYDDYWHKMNGI
ncbi:MAG TPA: hypothetical protein VLF87_00585, partial [Patescibacteria group bacterium]|nr:hypothetical protein [Patescibacteria group bacterium]